MQNLQKKEPGSLSKSQCQELQMLYTQGVDAVGSVRNLVKASNLLVSKVRQLLPSRPSFTKFTLATRIFKWNRTFAKFKNEIWYKEWANLDKLAKKRCKVSSSSSRPVCLNHRCQRIENKKFHWNGSCNFDSDYNEESTRETLVWQWNRICWRIHKNMQNWRITNLHYHEWD